MPFLRADIDRAIVMTQYDLRGFWHPMGFRIKKNTPKDLDAATGNFVSFAADAGSDGDGPTDEAFVDYFGSSFEDYLAMCKRLAAACDGSQKEAIQLIVKDIIKQHDEMEAEIAAGTREASPYLKPLSKDNRWGKAVLALQEAFGPTREKAAA